jgi:predicted hotdog family 3-hydroxylacyl-ACP dehydratase
MMLDHDQIARRIPHSGRMCLLNEIVNWDAQLIHARAVSHRQLDNPLRNRDGLGIAAGIEYAGQAMAVHGSLSSDGLPHAGRLASARGVKCHVRWLDRVDDDLDILARKLSGDDAAMVYHFEISAGARLLISGRVSVALSPIAAPH